MTDVLPQVVTAPSYEDEWSRPAVQRTELGPIMHILAHQVADGIEAEFDAFLASDPYQYEDLALLDVYGFMRRVSTALITQAGQADMRITQGGLPAAAHQLISNYRLKPARIPGLATGSVQTRRYLTHYPTLHNVLSEGLASGVVMPIKTYGVLAEYEDERDQAGTQDPVYRTFHDRPRAGESLRLSGKQIDVGHFLTTLRDPAFNKVLHQLSYASNGFYRAESAQPGSGIPEVLRPTPAVPRIFSHLPGQPVALSAEFLDHKSKAMKHYQSEVPGRESGGCPVRHSTYAKLGPFALRFLEESGISPDNLPTESAISRFRRLVADVAERMVYAIDEAENE